MSTVTTEVPTPAVLRPEAPGSAAIPVTGSTGIPVFETVAEYSRALDAVRRSGRSVGVVPTMGALHAGHRSLVERAARECDVVAVSIFVNPTQFGDAVDLALYPRTLEADLEAVAQAGGRLVFAPSVAEMYPEAPGDIPMVSAPELADRWEGASRPGHFDGVATVVVKLLSAAGSLPGLLRREGLPAAGAGPVGGAGPLPARRGHRVRDRPAAGWPGPLQQEHPSVGRATKGGPGPVQGAEVRRRHDGRW